MISPSDQSDDGVVVEEKTVFNRLHIIVDTREQAPWSFPVEKVVSCRGTLKTGDYALSGDEGFAVERKSLDDFLGTISIGWDRFLREIERMSDYPAKVVIVESDFRNCCFCEDASSGRIIEPRHNHPMLSPGFIVKRIAELSMMGVSVLFASDPGHASALCYQLLKNRRDAIAE